MVMRAQLRMLMLAYVLAKQPINVSTCLIIKHVQYIGIRWALCLPGELAGVFSAWGT